MRENKRKLKFKKIKIASMNFLKGGGGDTIAIGISDACPTQQVGCDPYPSSDKANPCSDGCFNITERPQPGESEGNQCLGSCTE